MSNKPYEISQPTGSVEVIFDENNGYTLTWSNTCAMSPIEHRLFCNYLVSAKTALVFLGVGTRLHMDITTNLQTLHSVASELIRITTTYSDIITLSNELSINPEHILSQLSDFELSSEVLVALANLIISGLCKIGGDCKNPSDIVTKLRCEIDAADSVSFGIVENKGDRSYPMMLVISCKYNGVDTPISEVQKTAFCPSNLTAALRRIAAHSKLISRLFTNGRVAGELPLSPRDLYLFLTETELYADCGVICRIPKRWRKHKGKLSVSYTLGNKHSLLSTDEIILSFDVSICLNGVQLSEADIQKLMSATDDVYMFRERWVEVKLSELRAALHAYEKARSAFADGMSLADAVHAYISPSTLFCTADDDDDSMEYTVIDGEWLSSVFSQLSSPNSLPNATLSSGFMATLRPYQSDGVNWLYQMYTLRLGACLCDDMGLGKTVQAIGFMDAMQVACKKDGKSAKTLIVIPASLLMNWMSELNRFAPHMKACVLHNSFGNANDIFAAADDYDVYITTYSMVSRVRGLKDIEWDCVIIDEAQSIKNPTTLQSRSVKKLKAKFKIAMTGTPIENSAMDLWSIFNFLNPNLLGSSKVFLKMLTESDSIERLKQLTRPFMLRRLKTDKSIIADLPDKIEMLCYCTLTPNQVAIYKRITDAMSESIGNVHGIERRGMVLSSILRLKQLCNHPDQLNGGTAYHPNESGKIMRLIELCESIMAAGEKVLVFTQFRTMCEPLSVILASVFNHEGLVIHGETSITERGHIVERFNDENAGIPFIVLSLRAGGVGLNLTAATHVIHFDRWWNPAVENQATDRAFRIGQTKNVIVHKMICTGTLEENIDKLISAKTGVADELIDGEFKVTEMSDGEIMSLLNIDEVKIQPE